MVSELGDLECKMPAARWQPIFSIQLGVDMGTRAAARRI
jgi:hypothetical protein